MDLSSPSPILPPSPPRRRTWGQIMGIASACLFPVLALLLVMRAIEGNKMPSVVIPPQTFPQPNAFDTFVRAGKIASKNDKAIGDAVSSKPTKTWTTTQKQDLLTANVPALVLVRSAWDMPYRDATGPRSYNTNFPHYAHFRNLARLFVLEGEIKAERGDPNGAAQSYADALVFGQKMAQGTHILGNLVSVACQAIGRKRLWQIIDRLDAQTARKTARRLEEANRSFAQNAPFAATLTEEKYWGQSTLMDVFRHPKQNPLAVNVDVSLLIWSKRTMMNNYSTFMDQLIAYASEPYQKHPDAPPIPNDPLDLILLPVFAPARYKSVANDTQNALLVTALAVRAYQADHNGTAPPDLQSLVPAYLSHVPDDPCVCPVAPLRYQVLSGGKLVLYSVGPDGKDNHGTPALNDGKDVTPANKYYSTPTSKGDIVADVNVI